MLHVDSVDSGVIGQLSRLSNTDKNPRIEPLARLRNSIENFAWGNDSPLIQIVVIAQQDSNSKHTTPKMNLVISGT